MSKKDEPQQEVSRPLSAAPPARPPSPTPSKKDIEAFVEKLLKELEVSFTTNESIIIIRMGEAYIQYLIKAKPATLSVWCECSAKPELSAHQKELLQKRGFQSPGGQTPNFHHEANFERQSTLPQQLAIQTRWILAEVYNCSDYSSVSIETYQREA